MEFLKHTLANGLEIISECNLGAHTQGLGFFVRTGSRDEDIAFSGVSHFLEHMTFKGTPTRSADDVNREFDEIGAYVNAYTSKENTVYYAALLPEYQEKCVDILADIMRPSLREEDFDTEKQVIIEEIMKYDDQPPFGADDVLEESYFGNHALAQRILGTQQSVQALTVEQMLGYFRQQYSPGNIVFVSAGHVDFDRLVSQLDRLCGHWEPHDVSRSVVEVEPRFGFHSIERENSFQQYVLQLAAAPYDSEKDRLVAELITILVGDDSGSRLYWELLDPGLAESVGIGFYEYEGAAIYYAMMSCHPDAVQDNIRRMIEVYIRAQLDGFTPQELAQAKSKLTSRIVLDSEKPRSRMFIVGGNWVQYGRYRTVREMIDAIAEITLDDIQDILSRFPLTHNTTLTVGPLKSVSLVV